MSSPERITTRTILNELLLLANLEKGLGYTIKALALYPGRAIREYLFENRDRMTRPFPFLVLVVAVATFMTTEFLMSGEEVWRDVEASIHQKKLPEQAATILHWITIGMKKYMNLFFLSSLPFLALGTYLFFREKGYNLAEHLVINCYIYSFQTVLYIIFIPFMKWGDWIGIAFSGLLAAYTFYAYVRTFEQRFWPGFWKCIGVYFFSQVASGFAFLIIGAIAWVWLSL